MSALPSKYAIVPQRGIHKIKDGIKLKYMGAQAEQLLRYLDEAIDATWQLAPTRMGEFKLDRSERSQLTHLEDRLEEALWNKWKEPDCDPVSEAWDYIVANQFPLYESRHKMGWDRIDLLGVSAEGFPVVIELKADEAEDTLLRVILEALAYGIALKKNWGNITDVWSKTVRSRFGFTCPQSTSLERCQLVCAAPLKFWEYRRSKRRRGKRMVFEDAWQPLFELIEALEAHGYPVKCVAIDYRDVSPLRIVGVTPIAIRQLGQLPRDN